MKFPALVAIQSKKYRDASDTKRLCILHKKQYPQSKASRDTFSRAIRTGKASAEILGTISKYYRSKINKLNQISK